MLARSAFELMERYLRNAPYVDPDRWQGPAASDAGREPLVECPVVRNGSRVNDISYPLWSKSIRTLVCLYSASASAGNQRRASEDTPTTPALGGPNRTSTP